MECNKDEAVRAKEIAEKKLSEKDISGAKKFASKAQNLFPGLEGLSHFQEVLDVYTAVESKANGVVDWYKVLGVNRFADDETIRKKYRKLVLAVHPDKNKSAGADGAFTIISQAWNLLSDKVKKAVYDQKLNVRTMHSKFTAVHPTVSVQKNGRNNFTSSSTAARNPSDPSYPWTGSTPSESNGGTKFTSSATAARYSSVSSNPQSGSTPNKSNGSTRFTSSLTAANNSSAPSKPQTDSNPSKSNGKTFWTLCKQCMTNYEYVTLYLNKTLLCPSCHLPFLAKEMPAPPPKHTSRNPNRKQKMDNSACSTSSDFRKYATSTSKMGTKGVSQHSQNRENVPQNSVFKSGGSRSLPTPAMDAAQTMSGFTPTGDSRKRGHGEPFRASVMLDDFGKKRNATKHTDGLPTNNVPIFGKGAKSSKKMHS